MSFLPIIAAGSGSSIHRYAIDASRTVLTHDAIVGLSIKGLGWSPSPRFKTNSTCPRVFAVLANNTMAQIVFPHNQSHGHPPVIRAVPPPPNFEEGLARYEANVATYISEAEANYSVRWNTPSLSTVRRRLTTVGPRKLHNAWEAGYRHSHDGGLDFCVRMPEESNFITGAWIRKWADHDIATYAGNLDASVSILLHSDAVPVVTSDDGSTVDVDFWYERDSDAWYLPLPEQFVPDVGFWDAVHRGSRGWYEECESKSYSQWQPACCGDWCVEHGGYSPSNDGFTCYGYHEVTYSYSSCWWRIPVGYESGPSAYLAEARAPNTLTYPGQASSPWYPLPDSYDLVRTIQRVRVGFAEDGRVFIRPSDITFSSVISGETSNINSANGVLQAGGCNCFNGRNHGYASLDLHGTPFTVTDVDVFMPFATGSYSFIWTGSDNQAVYVRADGCCGRIEYNSYHNGEPVIWLDQRAAPNMGGYSCTPTPSNTPTSTPSPSQTASQTPSPSQTPSQSSTPSSTVTTGVCTTFGFEDGLLAPFTAEPEQWSSVVSSFRLVSNYPGGTFFPLTGGYMAKLEGVFDDSQ